MCPETVSCAIHFGLAKMTRTYGFLHVFHEGETRAVMSLCIDVRQDRHEVGRILTLFVQLPSRRLAKLQGRTAGAISNEIKKTQFTNESKTNARNNHKETPRQGITRTGDPRSLQMSAPSECDGA